MQSSEDYGEIAQNMLNRRDVAEAQVYATLAVAAAVDELKAAVEMGNRLSIADARGRAGI